MMPMMSAEPAMVMVVRGSVVPVEAVGPMGSGGRGVGVAVGATRTKPAKAECKRNRRETLVKAQET
jgi:hypothetical protein